MFAAMMLLGGCDWICQKCLQGEEVTVCGEGTVEDDGGGGTVERDEIIRNIEPQVERVDRWVLHETPKRGEHRAQRRITDHCRLAATFVHVSRPTGPVYPGVVWRDVRP